jgi:hypothetical protein
VIPALPDFLAQHPALQLMLSSTDRRVDLVREGLTAWCGSGRLSPPAWWPGPLVTIARSTVPAQATWLATVPRTLGDLAGHRLVHYGSGFGAGQGRSEPGFEYLAEDGHRALLPMAGALMVNDSETYLAAALAGLGIIQMPRVGVESLLAGELVSILPQWQPPPLPIHALYAHRRQLAPRSSSSSTGWRGCSPPISGAPQRRLRGAKLPRREGKLLAKEAGKAALAGKTQALPHCLQGEGGILQQAAGLLPAHPLQQAREVAPFLPQMAVEGPAGQLRCSHTPSSREEASALSCHSCWRMSVITLSR